MRFHGFPEQWKVSPHRLGDQKRDGWGQPIPGEYERTELPRALFAPGVSTEDALLSDAVEHKAQIFFGEYVEVSSADRIEVPLPGGAVSQWAVDGHPNHWPMGTVLTLVRAS